MKINRLILIILFFLSAKTIYAQVGTTGLQFLQIGVGARACGMGEAFTSLSNDASGIYWNPSGIGMLKRKEILFMHSEWLCGTRYEFFSGIIPKSDLGTFGLSLTYLAYGKIEGRDEFGHHLQDYSAYDFAFAFSYARKIEKTFSLGVTGKIIQSKIDTESGEGFAIDIGMLSLAPLEGLQLGFVIQNLGRGVTFIDEVTKLPVTLRSGISYMLPLHTIVLTPVIDFLKELDGDFQSNIGLEIVFLNRLALRGGYKISPSHQGITAGLGIIQKVSFFHMNVDYAYGDYGDLGMSHRISIDLEL